MDPPTPNTSSASPDKCWHCGYDLNELDTGVCPECGVRYVTGKDLERLHDKLVGGDQRHCITCGTQRPDATTERCPTCGMRYARPGAHHEAPALRVSGVVAPASTNPPMNTPGRAGQRRRRGAGFIALVLAGLAAAVGLVVLADRLAPTVTPAVVVVMKLAALLLAGAMLGWLLVRLVRRDVASLQGQLSSGPRGWSHRVVGRCPNCGYDRKGLDMTRCPECGLELPEDHQPGTG